MLVEGSTLNNLSEQTQFALSQSEIAIIAVADTRLALQHYASSILSLWHPTVIAVAGSVGKTSTKEAIADVLASQFTTFRSWQNYNDLLGIPLSLGRLEPRHEYAVLELGCDHPGEIADLCRIVRPQIGVLTNISSVQLQYFNSLERLALELSTLLTSLPAGGHFFYNQDDETIHTLLASHNSNTDITLHPFSLASPLLQTKQAPASIRLIHLGWDGIRGKLKVASSGEKNGSTGESLTSDVILSSHLMGAHSLATMLAAYQVGLSRGIHPRRAERALAGIYPLSGRLNPLPGISNSCLLDDTHNASPASVIAGLDALDALASGKSRRIAVLGDMRNLGEHEAEAHRSIGHKVAQSADYLVTRGEWAALIAESAQQAGLDSAHIITTSTHEDAAQAVRRILEQPGQATNEAESESGGATSDVVLIKGSEATRMERVTEMLMTRPWEASEKLVRQTLGWKKIFFMHAERPTWVEIDLNAIGSNTRHIKSLVGPQVQMLVALKADAYGHGALKVARTVLQNGATMLGVATVSEAVPLREGGIQAPILVFGYVPRWQMREAVRSGSSVTLYSSEAAHSLSQAAVALGKSVKVHVKIDTGMGRLGVWYEQVDNIIDLVRQVNGLPGLKLEGVYTHFAQADAQDQVHAHLQLARFQHTLERLEELGLRPPVVHAANSAAALTLPQAHFDMVRPGIAIYGLDPSEDVHLPEGFRPALSFKTQVSQVKWIPAGEGISYGSTYITEQPTCVAVLPVGYADGFRRSPRNWGSVLIHGREAPLLGRVCMDQCMVNVTDIPQVRVGDEVVLIGRQGEATLSAEQVAERLGTINYEVVSEILARVP
ncbi:MAG: alanine racemase, partial [Ktedonobacteraceae bacterium]|nr:alanine racemase [Ktedonobacteraceae bacterium]